ncbi:FliI/YscN family ATPase [Jonesia quinghaiensis]|uniref:FliI/YscN family ATPase n=1 Tax=Jonesia quinghaiensis TaxID=262806 RepID=UPI0004079E08|nr:FliI/YscN family ATPase [Jonesia quinghaiensis]
MTSMALDPMWDNVREAARPEKVGKVSAALGLSLDVQGLTCSVGDVVAIGEAGSEARAEVVAVHSRHATCMPLTAMPSLYAGAEVRHTGGGIQVPVGPGLIGRVIDPLGNPLDGRGPITGVDYVSVDAAAPHPLLRQRVDQPLGLGVRVVDTLMTVGRGQRMGLFAGSGVGKSTLLSMIARGTDAQLSVIALIGERGREVREFLEDDLGPEGLARSVVVIATSDQPALLRQRAAFTATRIAQWLSNGGNDVVLMMDSLTRVAMAQREIGLSAGEPPATRGYPPSTFAVLANLLERAGASEHGTITGLYTVLVDGDDHNEPIADAARSILDGHIVLDRRLAVRGHYPSIDALASISRVAGKVNDTERKTMAETLRRFMAAKAGVQDLIDIGAYAAGANAQVDAAITYEDAINAFLQQGVGEPAPAEESWNQLRQLTQALTGDVRG